MHSQQEAINGCQLVQFMLATIKKSVGIELIMMTTLCCVTRLVDSDKAGTRGLGSSFGFC